MLHNPGKIFAILLAIVATGSLTLFVTHRWQMPVPASLHAGMVDRQLNWALLDSGVLFIGAQLVLVAITWKSHIRKIAKASNSRGITIAIWISVVFIAVELFGAATLGRSAWAAMYNAPTTTETIRVQAMGQQFAFYFRYPGADGKFGPIHLEKIDASIGNYFGLDRTHDSSAQDDVTDGRLVLPVNRPVELILVAQDVIHGFYVRELRIQQDMVPGMEIPVHFTPTRIGKYEIVCSQLCGLGHYRMRAYLEIVSQADFDQWMQAHRHQ